MPRRGEGGALAVGEQVERLSDVAEGGLGGFEVVLGLSSLGGEPALAAPLRWPP